MSKLTRRDLLKTSLAATAGALSANAWPALAEALPKVGNDSPSIGLAPLDQPAPRERLLLDFGWRFHLGHANDPAKDFGLGLRRREAQFAKSGGFLPVTRPDFKDNDWREIDLPHDWAVELPFTDAPLVFHQGAKPVGREFPETSVGWYRKIFDLPKADTGKRISIDFDGVFRDAMVMFNGHYLGENQSGYAPCRFDVTDLANFGDKNVLVVRADATLGEGWFYEGAGIYRHVWLKKTDPLHLVPEGTFIRSELRGSSAIIRITAEVNNEMDVGRTCRVTSQIVNAEGKVVASAQTRPAGVPSRSIQEFELQTSIPKASLWSVERPALYRAITTIELDGLIADREETTFGIRTIRFDADKGFFLNDEPLKIKGTCNHQDHAGVGSALPDRLQYFRIEKLKEMGCNAYRTSHNPPTPELLDACDRLGMMVMDETRMMDSTPEGLSQLERLIRRDRNHPSVIMWSLGNEEREQGSERGARIVTTMKAMAKSLDPTRPVTVAMNGAWGRGVTNVVDVMGFNYAGGGGQGGIDTGKNIDAFHAKFPKLPSVGSEMGSEFFTRGIYANDKEKGYVSAYDLNHPGYTTTTEGWWKVFAERSFLAGAFNWTGFDYRGEPSPYPWPCISSHFGILDTCGFPKDIFYYYRSWWQNEPVLHLFPHWNWSGREGQEIDVWCYSNLESVELFLNGQSLGAQKLEPNSHLEWKVKYVPGVIEARGSKGGRVVLTARRETTSSAARLALQPDRLKISANGEDLAVAAVEVQDARGLIVPTAGNEIAFTLKGPGRIIGIGNGDPSCHEADRPSSPNEAKRSAFNGLAMVIVQGLKQSGEIRIEATAPGLEKATAAISAQSVTARPAI
jgi:beta-galactosidase